MVPAEQDWHLPILPARHVLVSDTGCRNACIWAWGMAGRSPSRCQTPGSGQLGGKPAARGGETALSPERQSGSVTRARTRRRSGASSPELCPVTLLELLAATAPARLVATELLVRRRMHGLLEHAGRRRDACHDGASPTRFGDRLSTYDRFVLVAEVPVLTLLLLGELLCLLGRELRVEDVQHDLAANRAAEIGEHALALGGVLDERVLLRHRAQMHPLPQVVHVLEVLAPTGARDL